MVRCKVWLHYIYSRYTSLYM